MSHNMTVSDQKQPEILVRRVAYTKTQ